MRPTRQSLHIVLLLIIPALLAFVLPGAIAAQTIPAPLPEPAPPPSPGPATVADITLQQWQQAWRNDAPMNAFGFRDPQNGLAVGDTGRIMLTVDGGQSWRPAVDQTLHAWHLQSIAYATAETIYVAGGRHIGPIVGSTGGVLMSSDGGRSWQRRLSMPRRVWTVLARGPHVLACAEPDLDLPSGLMASNNGGATWTAVAGAPVAAVSAVPGRAASAGPVISAAWISDLAAVLITAGGEISLYNSTATPQLRPLASLGMPITAARIRSQNHWLVAGQNRLDGAIRQTEDGGRTWRAVVFDPEPLPGEIRDFIFTGQGTVGWALSAGGRPTYFTRDGGTTWQVIGTSPGVPVRAFFFHDAWNGLAAGAFGTIYRTTDGGGTWAPAAGAGQQTRPAVLAIAPLGDTDDLPLVSMLAGDRGYRAIVWYITRPADAGVPLIVAERRLRDALLPRWGAAGLILGSQISARREGRLMFDLEARNQPAALFDDAEQAAMTRLLLGQALVAWQPTVVVSPDAGAADPEAAFIGQMVRQAVGDGHPAHWIRNGGVRIRPPQPDDAPRPPQNAAVPPSPTVPLDPNAADGRPGATVEGDELASQAVGWRFMTVDPLVPSEVHGLHHGLLAARAASVFRQQSIGLPATVRYGQLRPPGDQQDAPQPAMLMLAQLRAADALGRRDSPQVAVVPLAERQVDQQVAQRMMTNLTVLLERGNLETALEMVEDAARARAALDDDDQTQVRIGQPPVYDLARYAAREVARRAALAGRDDLAARGFAAIMPAAVPTWQQLNTTLDYRGAEWIAESLLWQMQSAGSLELRRLKAAAAAGAGGAAGVRTAPGTGGSPPPTAPALTQLELAEYLTGRQGQLERITGRTRQSHLALLRLPVEGDVAVRAELLALLNETVALLPPELAWPARLHLWLATDRSQASPVPMVYLRRQANDRLLEGEAEVSDDLRVQVIEQADALNILIDRDLAADFWLTIDIDGDGSTVLIEPFVAAEAAAGGDGIEMSAGLPLWLRQSRVFARERMGDQLALRIRYAALGGRPARGSIWLLSLRRQWPEVIRPQPWPVDGSQGFFAVVFE